MLLIGEDKNTIWKNSPSVNLSTTNHTRFVPGSNPASAVIERRLRRHKKCCNYYLHMKYLLGICILTWQQCENIRNTLTILTWKKLIVFEPTPLHVRLVTNVLVTLCNSISLCSMLDIGWPLYINTSTQQLVGNYFLDNSNSLFNTLLWMSHKLLSFSLFTVWTLWTVRNRMWNCYISHHNSL
jgi:hypothetical protein